MDLCPRFASGDGRRRPSLHELGSFEGSQNPHPVAKNATRVGHPGWIKDGERFWRITMRDAGRRPKGRLLYWYWAVVMTAGVWLCAFGLPAGPPSGGNTTI